MKRLIVGGLVWLASLALPAQACDFNCTLKTHLDAIQSKNFEAFSETITREAQLSFLLPNGKFFAKSSEYKEMLKEWFATPGWTFNYQIITRHETAEMGHALLLVSYDEESRNGKPYHIDHYLSLLFMLQNGKWMLVHDQNTQTNLPPENG